MPAASRGADCQGPSELPVYCSVTNLGRTEECLVETARAHALEGRLFRSAVERPLQDHEIRTEVLLERDAYASVAARLKQSSDDVKRAIQDLGRSAPAKVGPWRAEQKLAALAALLVLR